MYEQGQGVLQNYAEAAKWHLKAAEQDNGLAQTSLGRMYDLGLGVPQNCIRAHMWFNLATYDYRAHFDRLEQLLRAAGLITARPKPTSKKTLPAGYARDEVRQHTSAADRDRVAAKMTPAQLS